MYIKMIKRRLVSLAIGMLLLFAASGCAAPAENPQKGFDATDVQIEESGENIPDYLFDFEK